MLKRWIKQLNCKHVWSEPIAVSSFGWNINRLHVCIKCAKFTRTVNTLMPIEIGNVSISGYIIRTENRDIPTEMLEMVEKKASNFI